jgi:hypothetical protein
MKQPDRGADDLLRARFAAQLLAGGRARDPVSVADRILAVQAQDLRSARLAVRARTRGLGAADVDRALTDDRSLVIGWLNRGTLQLVRREDYWWLHALTTPPLFTPVLRRLAQLGVGESAAGRGVSAVERALTDEGPLTRYELRNRVEEAGVPTAGQALIHLLFLTCLRGIALRGPLAGSHHAYVLARDWIGPPAAVERDRALAELARRYLAGHAPAADRDLAKWAGLPLRDARAGLDAIAGELGEPDDGLVALRSSPLGEEPRPCLLDQWDPLLVGWRSREPLLRHRPERDSPLAQYRPYAYLEGRAVATWRLSGGAVELGAPYRRLTRAQSAALTEDAADVARFLGSV